MEIIIGKMLLYKLGEMIPKLKTRVGKSEDIEETKSPKKEEVPPSSPSKKDRKKKKNK